MTQPTYRILVADDDPPILELLGEYLATRGHSVTLVPDGERALQVLDTEEIDVLVTDLKMPGTDGLSLLQHVRENNLSVATIMMTGYGTIESAISALKSGAHNYLLKPFRLREVHNSVASAVEARKREQATLRLENLLEIQEKALGVATPKALEELYALVSERSREELKAAAVSLAFFEPLGQRWVEYHRTGEASAFQGIDFDALADVVQRNQQPLKAQECWFGTPKHLLAAPIGIQISAGPARVQGLLVASEAKTALPRPQRVLSAYAGLLGPVISTQTLLQQKSPEPTMGPPQLLEPWNSQTDAAFRSCASSFGLSAAETDACSWALRLRANEGFRLRDLIEGGMLDVVTMGGGGLPMSTVEKLLPVLKRLDERSDGFGAPGTEDGLDSALRRTAELGAAFSRWLWLTEHRAFAPRLDPEAASRAMDAAANTLLSEEAASAVVETLGTDAP